MTDGSTTIAFGDIDGDFVPRPVRPVASVELDGDEVLYIDGPPMLFVLNPTARVVWHDLDGHISVAQLADVLAEEFGVPLDQMLADVLELVRELGSSGLLDGVTPDPDAVDQQRINQIDEEGVQHPSPTSG